MTWCSQAGQDEWVHSIVGDSGYFVDVGAYDGIEHSNTYALEQLGWSGVCIEPNLDAFGALQRNRRCSMCSCVVSAEDGDVGFDGIRVAPGATLRTARPLRDLLDWAGAPDAIDYLSIDAEGHDLAVLHGMGFDRWPVRLITVEHNEYLEGSARKLAILDYLTERGFECVNLDVVAPGYGCYESWYQRRDD